MKKARNWGLTCFLYIVVIGLVAFASVRPSISRSQLASPLTVDSSYEPSPVKEKGYLVITLTLTNTGDYPAKEINAQVVSPGFKTISEKMWPTILYPKSSVVGRYILEATATPGTYQVYVTITHIVNMTTGPTLDIRQFAINERIGDVKINSEWTPAFSTLWQGAVATSIGAVIGIIIAKTSEKMATKGAATNARIKGILRVKSLILNDLDESISQVQNHQVAVLHGREIIRQNELYAILAENDNLLRHVINVYNEMTNYSNKDQAGRNAYDTNGLVTRIQALRKAVNDWKAEKA
jgi:hypothetical protein